MSVSPAPEEPAYLDYRVRWRSGEQHPGKHAARHSGAGSDFRGCRPFWQLPDARRIDIRRSITNPGGEVMVRQTEQRSSLTVVLAADVSCSMRPAFGRSNLGLVATLGLAAARSALRAGDSFACLPFDRALRDDLACPPTRSRAAAGGALDRLRNLRPSGQGAQGILALAAALPARRCLVLLASDFWMSADLLATALAALARHDVAPIVLALDRAADLPGAGLLRLRDAETGQGRLLLMRPALHRRWRAAEAARRHALDRLFLQHGRAAFHAAGALDIPALSAHLSGG